MLKNNWTFHSVVLTKFCYGVAGEVPCGGENDATLVEGSFQPGKTSSPSVQVNLRRYVAYLVEFQTLGPAGTQSY